MIPAVRRPRPARNGAASRCWLLMPAVVLLAAGLTIIAGQMAIAQGGSPESRVVAIKGRQVDRDNRTIRAMQGSPIDLTFVSDESVELHLHGYDLTALLEPGTPKAMRFTANIAGRFPIEAHRFGTGTAKTRGHTVLLYLEVHPK